MSTLFYSPTTYGVLGAVLVLFYALYRAALPKPIPGIPYHEASAKSVLGDAPAMLRHKNKNATVFDWMTAQTLELNEPVVQLFLKPFSKPVVVVTDQREIQDVVLRRAKEFDRSTFFKDAFGGVCKYYLTEVFLRQYPFYIKPSYSAVFLEACRIRIAAYSVTASYAASALIIYLSS